MPQFPEWQPIATLPAAAGFVLVARSGFHEDTGIAFIPEAVWWDEDIAGWRTGSDDPIDISHMTHWMPAPANPGLS